MARYNPKWGQRYRNGEDWAHTFNYATEIIKQAPRGSETAEDLAVIWLAAFIIFARADDYICSNPDLWVYFPSEEMRKLVHVGLAILPLTELVRKRAYDLVDAAPYMSPDNIAQAAEAALREMRCTSPTWRKLRDTLERSSQ